MLQGFCRFQRTLSIAQAKRKLRKKTKTANYRDYISILLLPSSAYIFMETFLFVDNNVFLTEMSSETV